jgi:putative peptidoglycan lipid II flippase
MKERPPKGRSFLFHHFLYSLFPDIIQGYMILKNSVLLAIFSFLSVLLGIVRDRLLATHVGVGPVLDIYNASFRLPDLLYSMSLAFVTAGTVVPFLTVENKSGNIVDSRHRLSSISLFFAGASSLIGLIIALTIPLYAHIIVPGFTEAQLTIFISVTRLLMLQPILLGVTSLISCFAQMKNHFVLYGIAPLGYSFGIIGGIIFLYPRYHVHGLVYGVLIGAFISFCIQLYSLRGTKFIEVLPYFSFRHIKELFSLSYPRTGVNMLTQGRTIFFTAFATTLGPGVLSSYLFAQRITDAVTQIIQQSVTTASLPVLSKEFVENRFAEYKRVVKRYVLTLGAIGFFAGSAIYFLKDIVITVLYGNTPAHNLISFFLIGFILVLPLQMMIGYFSISLYSAKDTKSVFYSNFISTIVAVFVCYVTQPLGNISLVYGVIAMSIANFTVIFFLYWKKKLHA